MPDDVTTDENPPLINPRLSSSEQRLPDVEAFTSGIRDGDRSLLSRAITLAESTLPAHRRTARRILDRLLPDTGQALRVGITGIPGVGKSTFIEALGMQLIEQSRKLAVLTVDPTSDRSRGSILGDKTRMHRLAAAEDAYIRPSPTGGRLGGVSPATREAIHFCEAAGFDVVFVETVGVGQSETSVASLVDVFLLLTLAGTGDELQGIKRGIMEMADVVAINKADRTEPDALEKTRSACRSALELFTHPAGEWTPPVLDCSALSGTGIGDVWQAVETFTQVARSTGFFETRRRSQRQAWLHQALEREVMDDFFLDPAVHERLPTLKKEVTEGQTTPLTAARELLALYRADDSR